MAKHTDFFPPETVKDATNKPLKAAKTRREKAVRITHTDFFRLSKYLEQHKDRLNTMKGMDAVMLRAEINDALKIDVAPSTVKEACAAVGVVLHSQRVRFPGYKPANKLEDLRKEMFETTKTLVHEMMRLMHKSNLAMSDDFKNLSNKVHTLVKAHHG